jgi:hypothetical protein
MNILELRPDPAYDHRLAVPEQEFKPLHVTRKDAQPLASPEIQLGVMRAGLSNDGNARVCPAAPANGITCRPSAQPADKLVMFGSRSGTHGTEYMSASLTNDSGYSLAAVLGGAQ